MKRILMALAFVLALGLVANAQDTTTLLSAFLAGLRNGTVTVPAATALGSTSTDGLILSNGTAATGAATVQISPRLRWVGNAWDTAASETTAFFAEVLPATAATPTATFKLGYSLNGAAATYPLTISSVAATGLSVPSSIFTTGGFNIQSSGDVYVAGSGNYQFNGRTLLQSASSGSFTLINNAQTSGIQDTFGADVTVSTCGTGSVTTKSKNAAGEITATGATACTVVFGSPTYTNKPFCVATAESGTNPTLVVNTTVSFTVTGLTSGAAFNYLCRGPI